MTTRRLAVTILTLAFTTSAWSQPPATGLTERLEAISGPIDRSEILSPSKPRELPARLLEAEAALSASTARPPLPGLPARPEAVPAAPPKASLLTANLGTPAPAPHVRFDARPPARQLSADIENADFLPVLGQMARDRASLADPTQEWSARLIVTPQDPRRLAPVPFTPTNLPDPFENAATIRLTTPWPESPEPPLFRRAPGKN